MEWKEIHSVYKRGWLGKIQWPILVSWGKQGVIEKYFRAIEEWQKVSSSTITGESLDRGNCIPEEALEELLSKILGFCRDFEVALILVGCRSSTGGVITLNATKYSCVSWPQDGSNRVLVWSFPMIQSILDYQLYLIIHAVSHSG